jgi:cysteine desulfurase
MIYLDNAATTAVDEEVLAEMVPFFRVGFGNAGSLHKLGRDAAKALELARVRVARLINAEPSEIIFTSGGTESDNQAIKKTLLMHKTGHMITTAFEHPAVLRTAEFMESHGYNVTYLNPGKDGIVSLSEVEGSIRPDTRLVSVMHANNEIGTIQPIAEIGALCRKKGIVFHTDAVQSLGKEQINVKSMNIDLISASAHKIHGPKGVGFLYVRKGLQLEPLMHGGSHERKMRAGTENVAGIVGFGKACEIASHDMDKNNAIMTRLRDRLVSGIIQTIPDSHLNGHHEQRLSNNAHVRFDYIEGEALLMHLDMEGIAVSTASACSSKSLQPSHVLTSIGLSPVQAHGSIRLTLSKYTTQEEIDTVLERLPAIVSRLRQMSPLNEKNVNDDFPVEEEHVTEE